MTIQGALLDQALLQSLGEHHEHLTAFQVGTVENGIN